MARWTARVAPLDVIAPDRRWLDPTGSWTIAAGGPVPLATIGGHRRQVGLVESVTVKDGAIWASGTVDDPAIAERMRTRELRPAVEFNESYRVQVDEGEGALAATVRFKSGRVAAIALVETSPWPDVWFTVDDGVCGAWPLGERSGSLQLTSPPSGCTRPSGHDPRDGHESADGQLWVEYRDEVERPGPA